ncbi:MAG: FadR family transcriptional regulator [Clostridia bacterium]|nr:FadR family transcriptional regulator [Clostridia bacterium]
MKGRDLTAETKATKLYEDIAARMIAQIHAGTLRPGDRLPPERALAEEYGVSRTAIREALRSMEMMGCVESRVGEGTFIKAPSLSNIVDPFSMVLTQNRQLGSELIEVRLILETEVAALAARRRTDEQLTDLEQAIQDMKGDIESGGMGVEADAAFHSILAEAAGNEALHVMLDMCEGMLSRTRPITQAVKGVPKMALKDHAAICEAIRIRDEKAARRLMRTHLNRALRNLNKAQKK